MQLVNDLAEQYAAKFTSPHDVLLQQIAEETLTNHAHAHMLSGKVQGQLLRFISTMLQPQNILEIGSFTGYSALCLAKGLQQNGQLHTIELRQEDAAITQQNFSKSKQAHQLFLHIGNALEIIPTLQQKWDLVFIDADKTNYINYYNLVLPQLNKNGIMIADNVLFHGDVLEENIKGKNAKAIHEFNKHIANDDRVEQVMLTVRDGLLLIKKK